MKNGARRVEQNEIKRRFAEGQSVDQISNAMRVNRKCVESFCKNVKVKPTELSDEQKAQIVAHIREGENDYVTISKLMGLEVALVEDFIEDFDEAEYEASLNPEEDD